MKRDGWTPPEPPAGCDSLEGHERELCRSALDCEAMARELIATKVPMNLSRAKELILTAARCRKQAAALAIEREAVDHINYLERRKRDLASIARRDANRPRLKLGGRS